MLRMMATLLSPLGIRVVILLSLLTHVYGLPLEEAGAVDAMSLSNLALTAALAWVLGSVGQRVGRQSLASMLGISLFFLLIGVIACCRGLQWRWGGASIVAFIWIIFGATWSGLRITKSEPQEDRCPRPNCPDPATCSGNCGGSGSSTGSDDRL